MVLLCVCRYVVVVSGCLEGKKHAFRGRVGIFRSPWRIFMLNSFKGKKQGQQQWDLDEQPNLAASGYQGTEWKEKNLGVMGIFCRIFSLVYGHSCTTHSIFWYYFFQFLQAPVVILAILQPPTSLRRLITLLLRTISRLSNSNSCIFWMTDIVYDLIRIFRVKKIVFSTKFWPQFLVHREEFSSIRHRTPATILATQQQGDQSR